MSMLKAAEARAAEYAARRGAADPERFARAARARWAATSEEQRSAHARMMNERRATKRAAARIAAYSDAQLSDAISRAGGELVRLLAERDRRAAAES